MKQPVLGAVVFSLLLTFVGRSAEFESSYLKVATRGTGPDVILIPGFACGPEVWSGVTKDLESRFRLHLIEVAGFAGAVASEPMPESYLSTLRDEVVRYIQVAELKKTILVGHSMGGLISLLAASKEAAVGKVIAIDSLPFFSLIFNPAATSDQVLPFATAWEQKTATMDEAQFEAQARASLGIMTKDAEKQELVLKWAKQSDRKVYTQTMRELMAYDARPELKSITCPVVVIHAYDQSMRLPDVYVKELYTKHYAGLKTPAQFHTIDGSFHFIMWDQPQKFSETLKEALTSSSY